MNIKSSLISLTLLSMSLLCSTALADDEEINEVIKKHFNGNVFVLLKPLPAGEYAAETMGPGTMGLILYHFDDGMEIPESVRIGGGSSLNLSSTKISNLNSIDDRTFEELKSGLNKTTLEMGEKVRVKKFYMRRNFVDLYLVPLDDHVNDMDMDKASGKRKTTFLGGGRSKSRTTINGFGLRFVSFFDEDSVIKAGDSNAVISEISKYLATPDVAQQVLEEKNNISIDIGMSESDLISALGKPAKTISIGTKKVLKYEDLSVTVENGLVTEVKVD